MNIPIELGKIMIYHRRLKVMKSRRELTNYERMCMFLWEQCMLQMVPEDYIHSVIDGTNVTLP